jgi:hypothetical protein
MKKQLTNPMAGTCDGTWMGDPGHSVVPASRNFVCRNDRRAWLHQLGDFFRLRTVASWVPAVLRTEAAAPLAKKSVIHIYLPGGMAAQELWDPKPFAPLEYRV